jgi:hypothetical protein
MISAISTIVALEFSRVAQNCVSKVRHWLWVTCGAGLTRAFVSGTGGLRMQCQRQDDL